MVAAICLLSAVLNNNQAIMPVPYRFQLVGEYSYDGEQWYPLTEESSIPAEKGTLRVRGHFDRPIEQTGAFLTFYCNHIGVSVYLNGELIYMDILSEIARLGIDLMPSMCGKRWQQIACPVVSSEDVVEFVFINYHEYGNNTAFRDALNSIYVTQQDSAVLESFLEPYIRPERTVGYTTLIVSIMLLGAAMAAFVLRSGIVYKSLKWSMITMFAGGYILFDVMMLFLTDELLVMRTYGRQVCMMLAVYFFQLLVRDELVGRGRKIAGILVGFSILENLLLMLLATVGKVLLFDTQIYWVVTQSVVCPCLILLCLQRLIRGKDTRRIDYINYIILLAAILLDFAGVGNGMYSSGRCAKITFFLLMIFYLLRGAKHIVLDYQASVKNKKLQKELESGRIAVMLSQIQPHFLYNSLTSVMDLCDSNPKQAKAAIADFADYLRGNLSALKTEKLIPFARELEHMEKYLRLEKLRFQEELEIVYDIRCKDFQLPALSVQPLVENAVKHGLGRKAGGGTVTIRTLETETEYIIEVVDDGVGFAEGEYADDGADHIGLENIRKRLDMMQSAKLEIESVKGEGTLSRILIPKRRG